MSNSPQTRRCTGGPCPHCPVVDHEAVRLHVTNLAEMLKHAPDAATKAALSKMAASPSVECSVCHGKRHVRVCADCDGRGHALVIVQENGQTAETNGEKCKTCDGCGLEAIDASQVGAA